MNRTTRYRRRRRISRHAQNSELRSGSPDRIDGSRRPGTGWGLGRSARPADFKYRDAAGRIKRQAARFRIYGFNKNGEVVKELTDEDADITWRVHLANKKAAWFAYDGTSNALAQFRGLKDAAKLELRNADVGAMEHHGGRYV